jgi:hypothetical protein
MIPNADQEMTADVGGSVIDVDDILTDTGGAPGPGDLYWDRVHVIPRRIDAGNIITTIIRDLDVINAYRTDDRSWVSLAINASGVTVNNPTLPMTLDPLEDVQLDVTISDTGAARVDGNLTFTFEGSQIVVVPITFLRLSAFPFPPERGVTERLEWMTRITPAAKDTERRQALRRRPRQFMTYEVSREDGPERQRIENFLFSEAGRIVGLPIWFEQTRLTVAATPGASTLTVASTANMDLRAGGTAMVWSSETTFEIVNVLSFTSTVITLDGTVAGTFPVGSIVTPLRAAYLVRTPSSTRHSIGQSLGGAFGEARYRIEFQVVDNDTEIASTAAFPTFNSKVLLSDTNYGDGVSESYDRSGTLVDGEIGLASAFSAADVARRTSVKRFLPQSPLELWQTRQLLHALRGRQVSFYLPTFSSEFRPTQTLASGTATMTIENVGYTEFAQSRQPRNVVRVTRTDGTTLDRTIISSAVLSATEEQVTMSTTWPSSILVADIKRVEILEKMRFDSDSITIEHAELPGDALVSAPVKAVLE